MIHQNIHFINPSREYNKNNHEAFSHIQTLEHFVNFGIYSIIQELKENGILSVFHDFQQNYHAGLLKEKLGLYPTNLVGISIISAFNASSGDRILKDIKSINKGNVTVVGGQHYIGTLKDKVFKIFPDADIVVSGEGEFAMLLIAKQWNLYGNNLSKWNLSNLSRNVQLRLGNTVVQGKANNNVINLNKIQKHTYKDYPDISKLFPSVEYSRGCPFHCTFCVNTKSNRKNFRCRSISSLQKSIADLLDIYKERPLRFYLQASNFILNYNEINNFIDGLLFFNGDIEWRTEIRVDTFNEEYFEKLYNVGLRIIDIGLDSASPDMLKIMRKSSHPDQYLKKARALLKAATSARIFTKINFLIHPGDNISTIETSKKWLLENKQYISAISVCPALLFPGSKLEENFEYYQNKFGTEINHNSPLSKWGVFELNPSSEVNILHAKSFSQKISCKINSRNNYAFAKSFGYHGHNVYEEDMLANLPLKKNIPTVPYSD